MKPTELHGAGVIDEIGSVDDGSTQTDSLALERQRGITIKSAVVSFVIDDVTVNLIDTPGHPDFIAEVERVLSVLDGAVLVISAVEGVQAQTRVLMRTLQRLCIPTLMFVNKIDRRGADGDRVLREIAALLTPAIVPMGSVGGLGTCSPGFRPYGAADAGFTARLAELLAVDGVRADSPLSSGDPGWHVWYDGAGAGAASCRAAHAGDAWIGVHAGGRDSGGASPRAIAAATGADARRGRAGVRV